MGQFIGHVVIVGISNTGFQEWLQISTSQLGSIAHFRKSNSIKLVCKSAGELNWNEIITKNSTDRLQFFNC